MFPKFIPAGEPPVLYCSAIAPLAPNEGNQGSARPCSRKFWTKEGY